MKKSAEKKYRPSLTLAEINALVELGSLSLTPGERGSEPVPAGEITKHLSQASLQSAVKTLKLFLVKADLDGVGAAYMTKERSLTNVEIIRQEIEVSQDELVTQYHLSKSLGIEPTFAQKNAYTESIKKEVTNNEN